MLTDNNYENEPSAHISQLVTFYFLFHIHHHHHHHHHYHFYC